MYHSNLDVAHFNNISEGHFPEMLGIEITRVEEKKMLAKMPVKKAYFAPNGFLHAGSIVTFADTLAGYATVAHLPDKGQSFTTLELKSNFVGAARQGTLIGEATAEHLGRTTQLGRVEVPEEESGKKVALFSCTQLVLY
ncbi:MAG: PaaI family thioesterase [Bacteroidota bacterium]